MGGVLSFFLQSVGPLPRSARCKPGQSEHHPLLALQLVQEGGHGTQAGPTSPKQETCLVFTLMPEKGLSLLLSGLEPGGHQAGFGAPTQRASDNTERREDRAWGDRAREPKSWKERRSPITCSLASKLSTENKLGCFSCLFLERHEVIFVKMEAPCCNNGSTHNELTLSQSGSQPGAPRNCYIHSPVPPPQTPV